jgi:hypothetical protein
MFRNFRSLTLNTLPPPVGVFVPVFLTRMPPAFFFYSNHPSSSPSTVARPSQSDEFVEEEADNVARTSCHVVGLSFLIWGERLPVLYGYGADEGWKDEGKASGAAEEWDF